MTDDLITIFGKQYPLPIIFVFVQFSYHNKITRHIPGIKTEGEGSAIDSVVRIKGFEVLFRDTLSNPLFNGLILFRNYLKEEEISFKCLNVFFRKEPSIQSDIFDNKMVLGHRCNTFLIECDKS